MMCSIPFGDVWRDLFLGEIAYHLTEGFVILREFERQRHDLLPPIDLYVYVKHSRRVSTKTRDRTWTVGELAEELGVTTRTLRFYEAEGLLAPERRGTVRIFHARDHARMRLILRGKRFGMSLPEIREIVDMYDGAATSERRQLELLLGRLEEIQADLKQRASDLRKILAEVDTVATQCKTRLEDLELHDI
jgi:DNA-binding transcriptional MerR regulator